MRHLSRASLLARVFETIPYPTFLVDFDANVLHANGAAERLIAEVEPRTGAGPQRIGDLLRCDPAEREPGGCGASPDCDDCLIRLSLRRALRGETVRRELAFMERHEHGKKREVCLQVSAAAIEDERHKLAVVTLDDVTDIFQLRSLMPLCRTCDRIQSS